MLDRGMKQGITETVALLKLASKEEIEKIPQSFIDFLVKNMDKNYKFEIPKDTPLTEMEIKDETKNILALISCLYLCDTADKKNSIKEVLKHGGVINEN